MDVAQPTNPGPRSGSRRVALLGALILYLVITGFLCRPILRAPNHVVPSDPGDAVLNTWLLWWNTEAIPFTTRWWNAPSFAPLDGALALSEHLAGLAPFARGARLLGATPTFTYNLLFFLSFPFAAGATFLLVRELSGRSDAAFLAGLWFGFAPYRIAHLAHLQVLASGLIPFLFFSLHRYLATRSRKWLAVAALSWLVQALTNGYFLFYLPVIVGLWVLWYLPILSWVDRLRLAAVAVAVLLSLLPSLFGYLERHRQLDLARQAHEPENFSADLTAVIDGAGSLALWPFRSGFRKPEGEMFPGVSGPALLCIGLVQGFRRRQPAPRSRIRLWLAAVALLSSSIAVVFAIAGPHPFPSLPWFGSRHPDRVLGHALVLLTLLGLSSPRFRDARARSSHFAFYGLLLVVAAVLCGGPRIHAAGQLVWRDAPYAWLMRLPGYETLRVPTRFATFAILGLAVSAGLAFLRLAPRRPVWRCALLAIVSIGAVAEGAVRKLPFVLAPSAPDLPPGLPADARVLELPIGTPAHDLRAMYRGMFHGHAVVNGYSGHVPRHYRLLQWSLNRREHDAFLLLQRDRDVVVVVNESPRVAARPGSWSELASSIAGVRRVEAKPDRQVFLVPRQGDDSPAPGPALTIDTAIATPATELSFALTDANSATRWIACPQRGIESVVVSLRTPASRLDAIELHLTRFVDDFPRSLRVTVERDRTLVVVFEGTTAGLGAAGALEDPRAVAIRVPLGGGPGQRIHLEQLAQDDHCWSIFGLEVKGVQ